MIPLNAKVDSGVGVYGDSEVPIILSRATWENSAELKNLLDWYPAYAETTTDKKEENKPPDYSSVDRIIIHDMGCDVRHPGCNDKQIDSLTIIQNIYRYHAVTRGWGDIGYHYIIDYWGNVYEGRYGGNGVRGAHTYYDRKCNNFNVGSVGILLMGNYEKTKLPEVMYEGLIKLVGWLSVANDLDSREINHTSEIWHSPKLSDNKVKTVFGCDLSQGGLTAIYTGPVVVGHGEVEKGNSDPGLVDLKRVRKEAGKLLLEYKNYIYTTKGDSKVYSIKNGIKKELSSPIEELSSLVVLNKNQLDIFPSSKKYSYPNGALVKSYTRDRVYLIEKNKRKPIFSEKLFNLRKLNWSDIKLLSDRDLARYSLGAPLNYPDGVLIKGGGPEVYLVKNNKRRHISSAILFNKTGFKWKDIIEINQTELLAHPLGERILLSDETLIKEREMHPVYLVKNEKRHWIKTSKVFLGLGYKWKNIITLSSQEISYYAVGIMVEAIGDVIKLDEKQEEIEEIKEETMTKINEPNIRIGIYKVPALLANGPTKESVKIRANGPYEVYKNGILLANKNANETIIIPYSKTDFYKFILVSVDMPIDKAFEIISYEDRPGWNSKLNDNLFRGIIEIKYSPKSAGLWVINELCLEDYLKGVAEALNVDSDEYLKAFVVAARSYTLFHIQNNGKYPGEIFHLKNWAYDQLYKGYGFEERAPNVVQAVEKTKGIVATYNNKPIRGVYSSDSGGITKNACEIFKGVFCDNEDYAYLEGGVNDPDGTIHTQAVVNSSHGVGMSSIGARKLAKMGKSFEEILKYYYLGVEVEKVY